jgi:acetyl/propionyl-CoA carboxylase alpha subunit
MKRVDRYLRSEDATRRTTVTPTETGADVAFDGAPPVLVRVESDASGRLVLRLPDGRVVRGAAVRDGAKIRVTCEGRSWTFEAADESGATRAATAHLGEIRAPMTGKIVAVFVKEGEVVAAGAPLLTLEAMKMEHRLVAPGRARVARVSAVAGTLASDGDVLAVLEDAPGEVAP